MTTSPSTSAPSAGFPAEECQPGYQQGSTNSEGSRSASWPSAVKSHRTLSHFHSFRLGITMPPPLPPRLHLEHGVGGYGKLRQLRCGFCAPFRDFLYKILDRNMSGSLSDRSTCRSEKLIRSYCSLRSSAQASLSRRPGEL